MGETLSRYLLTRNRKHLAGEVNVFPTDLLFLVIWLGLIEYLAPRERIIAYDLACLLSFPSHLSWYPGIM